MYPIAQVQEPYTAVGYLAQRVNLVPILKIKHPLYGNKPGKEELEEWSAWDICEGKIQPLKGKVYLWVLELFGCFNPA